MCVCLPDSVSLRVHVCVCVCVCVCMCDAVYAHYCIMNMRQGWTHQAIVQQHRYVRMYKDRDISISKPLSAGTDEPDDEDF